MQRNRLKHVLAGALIAAVSGCSSTAPDAPRAPEHQGGIQLGLVPVSGVTLSSVHYAVTSGALLIAEGDLPTPGTEKDFSFGLPLPVGSGYSISVSAASAETGDNITCGGSYGPFNVTANASSAFQIVLSCHDDTNGSILSGVQVATDACPRLVFDYVVSTPSVARFGFSQALSGKAHDLDGKLVSYSWGATPSGYGSFTSVTAATTSFQCSLVTNNLLLTLTASNGECKKTLSISDGCNDGGLCGNGVIDPGETCDTAIPLMPCPPNCFSQCGNGIVEAPVEDCEPGNTATCSATCHTIADGGGLCGDGLIGSLEACDGNTFPAGTPPGSLCSADCRHILPSLIIECFDGIVQAGEECDDAGPSATCSNTCKKVSTAACVACERAGDCFESVDECLGVAAPFSTLQQNQCFDVMRCIEQSNCFDGGGTLGKCYCGSLSTTACVAAPFTGPGSPDGACVAQIKAGFPTFTTNAGVLGGLIATNFPSGAAMRRLNCQKGANSSACLDVCGFSAGGPAFP